MSPPSPLPPPAASPDPALRLALLALFVASGFSALIYQSIWTQYLGLVLGHAAYAQTLVLVMFMGGMALGSWGVSRRTLRLRRLIGAYALVEAAIGVLGALFHPVFVAFTGFSQRVALPALQPLGLADAWQWAAAAVLIAPQTVLLGATFPLIAGGVLRAYPAQGALGPLGGLYFTNGIGAAAGALVATFVLLPAVGMPGALWVAAGLNGLLAVATALIGRRLGEAAQPPPAAAAGATEGDRSPPIVSLRRALLAATFFSSAASFGYEIGWVRLLNQALGTTLHGFELMLAAFIAGMAGGGLWVQLRGHRIGDLVRYAGHVQVAMGVAALLSLPLLAHSYAWVGWWLEGLARSGPGYTLYSLATALTALAIMVPAAFFAGMTLPLFTAALLRQGASEKALGQVYAANTLGAIVGVGVVVHGLLPRVGVNLSLLAAGAVDIAVGVLLLRRTVAAGGGRAAPALALAIAVAVFVGVGRAGLPDPRVQSLGVFRNGYQPERRVELDYFRDGSTATVSVRTYAQVTSIATNGKPDAGLVEPGHPPGSDELTMVMTGVLPIAAHPAPRRVGIIGWGSGMTTHIVLGSRLPVQVDTIEIERAMWEGAQLFLPRNARAYVDPRSAVHFDDARKFLATRGGRYDVLISEPSNPWVSGVSSLFTHEFYDTARRHLADDGLLAQWIHSYEMSDPLLAQMLAALLAVFPESELYQANTGDLVLLARKGPPVPLHDEPWRHPGLARELRRVGLAGPQDLSARRLAGPRVLAEFVRQQGAAPHSDFWPTVALAGPEQRFRRSAATGLTQLVGGGLPVLNVLDCRRPPPADQAPRPTIDADLLGVAHWGAHQLAAVVLEGRRDTTLARLAPQQMVRLDALAAQRAALVPADEGQVLLALEDLATSTLGLLDDDSLARLWSARRWLDAPWRPAPAVRTQLDLYEAVALRRWTQARDAARRLLAQAGTPLPAPVRDSTTVLGLLATAAGGGAGPVAEWQREFGPGIADRGWRDSAAFIAGWVAHRPVCAAAGP